MPIDGADNGMTGTNFVMTFSGEILAGADPTLLRTEPKRSLLRNRSGKLSRGSTRSWQPTRMSRPRKRKSLAAAEQKDGFCHRKVGRPGRVRWQRLIATLTAKLAAEVRVAAAILLR